MFQVVEDQVVNVGRLQRVFLADRLASYSTAVDVVPATNEARRRVNDELGAVLSNVVKVGLAIIPV